MTKSNSIWLRIRQFFVPGYTELHIFFMAQAFILLAIFNDELRNGIKSVFAKALVSHGKEISWAIMATVAFISGLILSIYHAFSSRPKSEVEKTIMLVFALGINGIAGVIAGMRIIDEYHGVLIIFPALNIFSSIVLIYLIGFGDDTLIGDSNAPSLKLFLGAVITLFTFYLCQYQFGLHWSLTFSICVAYAMNINNILEGILTAIWHNKSVHTDTG